MKRNKQKSAEEGRYTNTSGKKPYSLVKGSFAERKVLGGEN